jgi:hypothetical protein
METHKIISVKIVTGASLSPRWRNNMQIIETDKGTYIDNIEGAQFGYFHDAKPGYAWASKVGQTVNDIKIYDYANFKWLNKQ